MTKYIEVKVDTNDGDYNTKLTEISVEDIEQLKPLFIAIKNFKEYIGFHESGSEFRHKHNYPHGDGQFYPRSDLGEKTPDEIYPEISEEIHELFQWNYCPYVEYGFHSIVSIRIFEIINEECFI